MGITLGNKSLETLKTVHADIASVVKLAAETIEFPFDFSVYEGIRTIETQTHLFKTGASKTMDSRHLTGHAVDLVPYLNGQLRWEWPLIYPIATAMRDAAKQLKIPIRWGGIWDLMLTETDAPLDEMVAEYVERMKKQNGHNFLVFIDGPHFELPKGIYP